jgi:hypothetical protein
MHTTASIRRVLVRLAILWPALALGPVSIPATAEQPGIDRQDDVVVHLFSGRTMTAKIDARTDAAQLWLRWESPGAEVLRPIQWDRVAAAEINGNKISGKEFLNLVDQIRRDVPAQPVSAPAAKSIVMLGSPANEASKAIEASKSTASSKNTQEPKPPVQWLDIEATPARWDNYVETDGMSICIAPKDAYGRLVPVRGTLDVDLIAEHAGVVKLPYPFSRIGHWSQTVRPEDFGPSGAVYHLPFQDVNPELSNHLGPHGAIHATLSVPGQDTFEATADARIRPYSLIRDRLLQTAGRRFFPEETIGQPWEKK